LCELEEALERNYFKQGGGAWKGGGESKGVWRVGYAVMRWFMTVTCKRTGQYSVTVGGAKNAVKTKRRQESVRDEPKPLGKLIEVSSMR